MTTLRDGVHVVAGYSDVASVLRDPVRFSSAPMGAADPYLLGADGPAHARMRSHAAAALGHDPPGADELEGMAATLVAGVVAAGGGDLIADVARPLAAAALTQWLGLPPDAGRELDTAVEAAVPGGAKGQPDGSQITTLAAQLLAERSGERDPFAGLRDVDLPAGAARSVVRILLIAGLETTARFAGSLGLRVLTVPVPPHGAGVGAVIEEALRCDGPVTTVLRRTTEDVSVAGATIAAGSVIACELATANRDAAIYHEPAAFRPGRSGPAHLAFGVGPHRCPGGGLARRESAALAAALMTSPVPLRIAAPPVLSASPFVRGPERVLLTVR